MARMRRKIVKFIFYPCYPRHPRLFFAYHVEVVINGLVGCRQPRSPRFSSSHRELGPKRRKFFRRPLEQIGSWPDRSLHFQLCGLIQALLPLTKTETM